MQPGFLLELGVVHGVFAWMTRHLDRLRWSKVGLFPVVAYA
jgi:hypothetical protein